MGLLTGAGARTCRMAVRLEVTRPARRAARMVDPWNCPGGARYGAPVVRYERTVRADGPTATVVVRAALPSTRVETWAALTEPELVARWFRPVTGDLREGGRYHADGVGGGEILTCRAPAELAVTWPFGDVRIRLTERADGCDLELTHHGVPLDEVVAPPGAPWGAGPGWEVTLEGLAATLTGSDAPPWDEARRTVAVEAWAAATTAATAAT